MIADPLLKKTAIDQRNPSLAQPAQPRFTRPLPLVMCQRYIARMRRLLTFCSFLLYLFAGPMAQAAQVAVLLGSDDPPYREFLDSLRKTLTLQSPWQITWEGTLENFRKAPPKADLIITAGPTATRQALEWAEGPPVMAALITRSAFQALRTNAQPNKYPPTALYLDQPLARQVAFINKLLPSSVFEARHLFSLVSPPQSELLGALQKASLSGGFKFSGEVVTHSDQVVAMTEHLLSQKNGIFLALPDNAVFTRDNIRPFLLTTYRYRAPVIAFSIPFAQAGALASLHATPAQMGQEIGQWILKLPSATHALPAPREAAQFSVFINTQVARSLKLNVPSEGELVSALNNLGDK